MVQGMNSVTDWMDARLLDTTFEDALALLERARAYVGAGTAASVPAEAQPLDRIRMARDMSRVTSALTCCMSLLLLYRAVREDQLDRTEMQGEARSLLAEVTAQLPDPSSEHAYAPELTALIGSAHDLFHRVQRLQAMFDMGGNGGGGGGRYVS
ncbi:Protein of unknown function [Caenispirillum bisanense]|uniref:Uncharacterized protein n=1 Tax=Caenispirillum bisanense TaxID=414052 RepID=A0A286G0A5_9PROT|nr:Protein of unknown function [Caenispirillum bisanense]